MKKYTVVQTYKVQDIWKDVEAKDIPEADTYIDMAIAEVSRLENLISDWYPGSIFQFEDFGRTIRCAYRKADINKSGETLLGPSARLISTRLAKTHFPGYQSLKVSFRQTC